MTFAPQRLYPRFAGAAALASRAPGGLSTLGRLGGLVFDQQVTMGDRWDAGSHVPRAAVVGFPRTGSTFLTTAAQMWIGSAVPHLHDAHLIPALDRAGTPVMVPLRNPLDTTLSWSIYNTDDGDAARFRARVQTYTAWLREVLRLSSRHTVVFTPFEAFTSDPSTPLQQVLGHTHPPITAGDVLAVLAASQHDVDGVASTIPSPTRHVERDRFTTALSDARVQRALASAVDVYVRAVEQTGAHERLVPQAQRSA